MTKTGDTTRRTQWKNDEKNPRLRWKRQGRGEWRAYGDFREFSDVGGKQEALKTSDPDVARAKVDQRVAEFREFQKNKTLYGVQQSRRLEEYAAHHLIKMPLWWASAEQYPQHSVSGSV